ncbi:MAG: hypothetical protein HY320_12830 [Armatimonadetes bacterium]|nr:hypothetical protein [Armatimonadota bacterium]
MPRSAFRVPHALFSAEWAASVFPTRAVAPWPVTDRSPWAARNLKPPSARPPGEQVETQPDKKQTGEQRQSRTVQQIYDGGRTEVLRIQRLRQQKRIGHQAGHYPPQCQRTRNQLQQ